MWFINIIRGGRVKVTSFIKYTTHHLLAVFSRIKESLRSIHRNRIRILQIFSPESKERNNPANQIKSTVKGYSHRRAQIFREKWADQAKNPCIYKGDTPCSHSKFGIGINILGSDLFRFQIPLRHSVGFFKLPVRTIPPFPKQRSDGMGKYQHQRPSSQHQSNCRQDSPSQNLIPIGLERNILTYGFWRWCRCHQKVSSIISIAQISKQIMRRISC